MSFREPPATRGPLGEVKEVAKMAESTSAISRRSARLFVEELGSRETGNAGQTILESRYGVDDERDKERAQSHTRSSSTNISASGGGMMIPMVDLGKDLCGIFPSTVEDMGKQVIKSLQAAQKSTKAKVDGRPLNFGTVLPGAIYRSSFPMVEDFQFLATLCLKTIVSLVKKNFSLEFTAFMKAHGIRHYVIDMQGTKKVAIPDAIMHEIMEVTLDKQNHPLLIHCNHGKHRTGCATAVIRHIAGWNISSILEEYKCFANPKIRECDVKYISEYQVSNLEGLFTRANRRRRSPVLTGAKMARMLLLSTLMLSVWLTTAMFWQR